MAPPLWLCHAMLASMTGAAPAGPARASPQWMPPGEPADGGTDRAGGSSARAAICSVAAACPEASTRSCSSWESSPGGRVRSNQPSGRRSIVKRRPSASAPLARCTATADCCSNGASRRATCSGRPASSAPVRSQSRTVPSRASVLRAKAVMSVAACRPAAATALPARTCSAGRTNTHQARTPSSTSSATSTAAIRTTREGRMPGRFAGTRGGYVMGVFVPV